MARPVIKSWKEADEYLNAGRNKTERPLYSSWRIKRSSTNDDIVIRHKDNDPDLDVVVYHSDGSVTLSLDHSNKAFELIQEYNGQELNLWGQHLHLPSFGNEPDDWQPCQRCEASGQMQYVCTGPGTCMEVEYLPQYLVETGAPGAHCAHFETTRHKLAFCDHQESETHTTMITCNWCDGKTQRNHGGAPIRIQWPTTQSAWPWGWEPITIKDGKIISKHAPHNHDPHNVFQKKGVTANEESSSNVMAGSL